MLHTLKSLIRVTGRAPGIFALIGSGKANRGFCHVCGHKALFLEYGPALRDSYACMMCNSRPRQRALMKVLNERFSNWQNLKIFESSPSGPCSALLKRQATRYDYSQYFEDLSPGELQGGVRCENLESLTMADDTYDLLITQDVFEHVLNPAAAFAEVARVLKPGGAHVFTVPLFDREQSTTRAIADGEGGIQYLMPPDYHRNPVDPNGSLVVTEWGRDLPDFIKSCCGLSSEIVRCQDRQLGLDGRLLEVIITSKPENE